MTRIFRCFDAIKKIIIRYFFKTAIIILTEMKIKVLLLMMCTMLVWSCQVKGQHSDTLNQTDAHGRRQGTWIKKDASGRLIYRGQFADDVPVGEFIYYDDAARIKVRQLMSDSGTRAATITYHPGGQVQSEGNYLNRLKTGEWKYYDQYGQLLTTENYVGDTLHGDFFVFYQNGDTAEILHYDQGLKHGEWIQYFKDGTLKTKGLFVNDTLHDTITFYQPNGKVRAAGKYNHGLKTGAWIYYIETGEVERIEHFVNGVKKGQEVMIELPAENYEPIDVEEDSDSR
jgi:antitoxin component YwqK of YwqJK toxin-antitoxin module